MDGLGVLFTGFVEKKNPHTGKKTRKFLVLTHVGVHWFKRTAGYDLFGEERGCMKLGDLEEVVKVDEKSAGADFNLMFEVKTKTKHFRRFITESEDQCDQWIKSIEHAMSKTFQDMNKAKRGGAGRPSGSIDETNSPAESSVLFLTVSQGLSGQEYIVDRNRAWGKEPISLPGEVLGPNDSVVITLSDGGVATLGAEERLSLKGPTKTLKVYGGELVTEVKVGVKRHTKPMRLLVPGVLLPIAASLVLGAFAVPKLLMQLEMGGLLGAATEGGAKGEEGGSALVIFLALVLGWNTLVTAWVKGASRLRIWDISLIEHVLAPPFLAGSGKEQKTIPKRYVDGCFGNVAEAYRYWFETCKWREDQKIDRILEDKPPMFKEVKAKGLHFIVGNTASGQPIFYLRPAGFDLEGLAALNGVGHAATLPEKGGESELQRHFIFIIEYIFTIMKSEEEAKTVLLLDMRDVSMKHCMGDTWEFWRGVVRICQDHYPERCEACFVLNIPPFFSFIYKLARAFINPTTLKKVQIVTPQELAVPDHNQERNWFSDYLPSDTSVPRPAWWKQLQPCLRGESVDPTVFNEELELERFVADLRKDR